MKARPTDIHTHRKWGRMAGTVEAVLRPIKRAFGGAFAGKSVHTVPLDELRPQMLVDESPPTADLTKEQAKALHGLAAHGPQSR
jgi:hypothetical protein